MSQQQALLTATTAIEQLAKLANINPDAVLVIGAPSGSALEFPSLEECAVTGFTIEETEGGHVIVVEPRQQAFSFPENPQGAIAPHGVPNYDAEHETQLPISSLAN